MDRLSKRGFFDALQRLDDLDNSQEEPDDSLEKLFVSSRPSRIPNLTAARTSAGPPPISLHRSNTEPQASSTYRQPHGPNAARFENPRRTIQSTAPKVRTVQRAQTTGTMPRTKTGGPPAKKRRSDAIKLVPENQQIFKGLSFCMCLIGLMEVLCFS
jgi:hypothetical protein